MPLDLASFEKIIRIRQLDLADFHAVVELQLKCFPGMTPWTMAQFESQLRMFPEGQVGVEAEGRLVATSASLIVDDSDYAAWHDWYKISDNGFIRNHDPEGDTLYGIEMQVDPAFRGMKIARRLYQARKDFCRARNLARMLIGGRIPGYADVRNEMTPQAYVNQVITKRLVDPVLTAQLANGFVLKQLIPDYMPSDEDSAGFATCLEWSNLDYQPVRSRRTRHAVAPIRIATVQYSMRPIASFDEFARQCMFYVDSASDAKADFVLFPELFTLQLLSIIEPERPGLAARKLAEFTPKFVELFHGLATRYNINIVGGSNFTEDDGRLRNTSFLFRRDGTISRQEKIHVTPNEKRWWGIEGGDSVEVFDTDCGKVAILICYDIEFPELGRVVADAGARVVFVPYNTNDRYGHMRVQLCARARCIENHLFVVTSGCVGNLPFVENADIHYAQSAIFTPSDIAFARDGIAAECNANVETVLIHDVDTELLRRHRRQGTVQNWNDRRRDLYGVRFKSRSGDGDI